MKSLAPRRALTAIALAIAATLPLAGCSVLDNVVDGVVGEAQEQLDGVISETLGGAGISTDGELPTGYPAAEIPVVGEVQGGGSAPDSSGWVVVTTLSGADQFAVAQGELEAAGFVASGVNTDADGGFGTFTLEPYTVVLTVATDAEGATTGTYVVTVTK